MKKTVLVLSGGGFKGAFQVGAIKYLKENWGKIDADNPTMKFDMVAGVSVGSLNGLLIALNRYEELVSLWEKVAQNGVEEIYTSDFIDTAVDQDNPNPELKISWSWDKIKNHFPRTTKSVFWKFIFRRKSMLKSLKQEFRNFKSIADNAPLKKKLLQYAKQGEINNCIYKCGYVSLNDGKYYSYRHTDFSSDKDFLNAVLASTAMPIIWRPVDAINVKTSKDSAKYAVDGGIRNVSPLGDVIKEISSDKSADEYTIIIINCSSGEILYEDYKKKNIAQIALRSLVDIAISEVFNNDIKEFIGKNYILEQIKEKYPVEKIYEYDFENDRKGRQLKYFRAIIIQPDGNILGDGLTANEILINKRLEHGYRKAELAVKKHSSNPKTLKFTIT